WQAPDEPAHYNYVGQVASGTLLPVIEMGDWDQAYLDTLKANGFNPDSLDRFDSIQYEDHQPPLYYWLNAPIFLITDGNLFALRMVSVLLGALTVALSYLVALAILPHRASIALATMALVAFLPQNLHILASVNNDALAGVVIALLLWLCVRYLRGLGDGTEWQLGLVLGLAIITKTTTYFMAAVVVLVIVLRWWNHSPQKSLRPLLNAMLLLVIPALIFAGFYWGRNLATYGGTDFLGLAAHDSVVVGQPRTAEGIATLGFSTYLRNGITTTFNSFWGQFGWMAAPLDGVVPWFYPLMGVVLLVAGVGWLLRFAGIRPENDLPSLQQRSIFWLMIVVLLLTLAQFVYYNLVFQQFQGRYLFTGLLPFALAVVLGLDAWMFQLERRIPAARWLLPLLVGLLAVLDFYLIWRVIPGAL
ncbi:MAG: glycosyltransferase family 39 protein, partial [Anaerolineae bacterium]|nr:glycosyltransferase family 39 protein [Anaerolineae bacterium]